MASALRRELGLRDLVLFHIAAIVSVRWISVTASRGPSSLALWGLALPLFFLPVAFVVRDFSRAMPAEGGIYLWTREAFGPLHGFLCAWCYVVSNLFYFPALLVSVAGYATFLLPSGNAALQENVPFVALFSLGALGGVLLLHLAGLRFGKWLENVGGLSLWIPAFLLIGLGLFQVARFGSATDFAANSLFPNFGNLDTWKTWSNVCFAFAGFELASTMSGEIRDPTRTVPRSILLAGVVIVAIYGLGTLSVLFCLRAGEVHPVTGILQAISSVLSGLGVPGLTPVVAALLALGGLGALGAWLAGAARIPFALGLERGLPSSFARVHPRWGTPHVALLTLGGLSAIVIGMSFAGSTVRESYSVLNDATTILYFIPFAYLFGAHLRLRARFGTPLHRSLLAGAGLLATTVAVVLAAIPPAETRDPLVYLAKVLGGSLGMVLACLVVYAATGRRSRASGTRGEGGGSGAPRSPA